MEVCEISRSTDSFRKLDKVKCPSCGLEMETGYIFSSREIAWTNDGKNRLVPGLYEYETLLDPSFSLTVRKEAAFRCKECNIVLFEYNPGL